MKTELNPDISQALSAIAGREFGNVFLVACGGSLSIMHPGKYFLDRHSKVLNSDVYNADEFIARSPQKLDDKALVILCSQTGTTKETARAAEFARAKGAATIAMTLDSASPLANAAENVVNYQAFYTTGVPIDAAESNYGVLYMLLAGLVKQTDGIDVVPSLLKSLSNLQPAIDKAHDVFAPLFEDYAPRLAKKDVIYTLASGANYGAAYSFSICVLMEMQWINSQAIHANEYFHGPFEVTDKDASFIVMVGLDETRRLEERARDFALRFGSEDNVMVLDAEKLDLTGIDDAFRGYLVPLVFFDTLWRFAYKIADLRGQPMLEGRRYMKKISDY
ncbi:SIS domain-containing protein [Pelagibacterium lacus]|uniref:SIS domain-containing protein n=1 Tax=Pelagibacterium lacus TaxID=2282655 RepID=A0A369W4D4_9HYPH|nr:SIS domain-containing protein [Pelagibacterium lacus]RDE08867.1 SIS domain-containing protein [Pelagibacterium lacus]